MTRTSKQVIIDLNNGIIPLELDFRPRETVDIDWGEVFNNSFMRSPAYYAARFPPGMRNLPGFDILCERMAANTLSPAEEMEARQEEAEQIKLERTLSQTIIDE